MGASSPRPPMSEAELEDELLQTTAGEPAPELSPVVLASVAALSRLLATAPDVGAVFEQALAQIITALPGSAVACLYLQPDESTNLTLAACYPQRSEDNWRSRAELAAQVVDYVKPITLMVRHIAAAPYSPVLGVPLCTPDQTLGALIIEANERIYSDNDTELLTLFAAQFAMAIENHQLRRAASQPLPHAAGAEHYLP